MASTTVEAEDNNDSVTMAIADLPSDSKVKQEGSPPSLLETLFPEASTSHASYEPTPPLSHPTSPTSPNEDNDTKPFRSQSESSEEEVKPHHHRRRKLSPPTRSHPQSRANSISPRDDDDSPFVSKASSPVPTSGSPKKSARRGKKEEVMGPPQLIGDLPLANDEARATFVELPDCTYASRNLGDQVYFDEDSTRCDCTLERGDHGPLHCCGDDSNCVNRLMQMECVEGDCRGGRYCENQRFQKKEYGPIDIVQTEKKGFGVRAREDMVADTFIYEYIGEVIGPAIFRRKMTEYAEAGIRHFYFMALDKEVFIDATKKGGLGRFLNHSCNPNCVVAKWTVGKKMRMGIFTKRDIAKDEELTFNYNVDRYGHTPQECYCGEPNCVGFIGGKTQTDIGGMDELYIDALGITEEVEAFGLRGTKKKKGKKLDEDFTPTMKEIAVDEVPKVATAIRQAITNRRILEKLLSRIQMTRDEEVQRQLLRLKGFMLMNHILMEYPEDLPIITLDLEILTNWPLIARNKVESSKIEESVVKCKELPDARVQVLSSQLLENWAALELGYRIPKAEKDANAERTRFSDLFEQKRNRIESPPPVQTPERPTFIKPEARLIRTSSSSLPPPEGWRIIRPRDGTDRVWYENSHTGARQREVPTAPAEKKVALVPTPVKVRDVTAIIEAAQAEAERKRLEEEGERRRSMSMSMSMAKGGREESAGRKKEASESGKEKKVMALFGAVVVAVMSKYRPHVGDNEQFKKRAKELTQILCDKEKKHPNYAKDPYDRLSSDKESKVKAFAKDWIKRLIEKSKARQSSSTSTANSTPSTSAIGLPASPSPSLSFPTPTQASGTNSPASNASQAIQTAEIVDSLMTDAKPNGDDGGGETPPGTPPSKRKADLLPPAQHFS